MKFTEESIKLLAPDESSIKAGQQLASTSKWINANRHDKALWGECQGSGKNPYFTQIDLEQIAFKCTCPSRKFPCKHGLGLLLLSLKSPDYFQTKSELPEQVIDWLEKRQSKAEAKQQKEDKPIDEKAQQKRQQERENKVNQGIVELQAWMKDIIRTGIQNIPSRQYSLFQNMNARLIDAQAMGLASMVKSWEEINYFSEGWEKLFMQQFSRLFLITEAYKNIHNLSFEWQQELKNMVGWNITKEQLSEIAPLYDQWNVLHIEKIQLDKLIAEKVWIWGINTQQVFYQLQFYHPQQLPQKIYLIGTSIRTQVTRYPSIADNRVMIHDGEETEEYKPIEVFSPTSFDHLLQIVTQIKALNPLLITFPFMLHTVRLVFTDGKWYLYDHDNKYLPLNNPDLSLWKIWALTQMNPIHTLVTLEKGILHLLSVEYKQTLYTL